VVFQHRQTGYSVRYADHNDVTLNRPMVRHAHVLLQLHLDLVVALDHGYRNGFQYHGDDTHDIHDYALASHTDPDGCYKTDRQNHDHESMIRQYLLSALQQKYCPHDVLFLIRHHAHENNPEQYNHWRYALSLLHAKQSFHQY